MGLGDKLRGILRVGEESEGEYEDYEEEEDYVEESEAPKQETETKFKVVEKKQVQPVQKRRVTMNDTSVCVFKPQAFDEAREIVETLMDNKTVLLNFENVDISISQRVLDIVTGACIAINGNLQKISNYIFIATPASVDVSGEFQDTLLGSIDSTL